MNITGPERIRTAAPVLDLPVTLNDLAAFLDASDRRFYSNSYPTTVHVASTGSNTTGTGSALLPFATIQRAQQYLAEANATAAVIQLDDAGPFAYPGMNPLMNFITVQGIETIEDTRTVSSVTSTTAGKEVVFVVSGATLADDAWRDRHLSLTGVFTNTRGFVVNRNVGNTIYASMYNRTLTSDVQSSPAGGTVNLLSFTEVQFPTTTAFEACFQMNFRKIKATGSGSTIFCQATDKVEFRYCQVEVAQINAGRAGGAYVISSALANYGNSNGMAQGRNKGDLRLGYSTVVSDRNASANNAFLNFQEQAIFTREGLVYCRGLDAKAFQFDGANAQVQPSSATVTGDLWFDDYEATAAASSCQGTINLNPNSLANGAFYAFGNVKGKANTTHAVKGSMGAKGIIGTSSALITTLGTNYVSADGGTTSCADAADGTLIIGGVPPNPNINSTVDTTDATVTTLYSFTLPTDSVGIIKVVVSAERTGGSSGTAGDASAFELRAVVRNVGGVVTLEDSDFETLFESQAGTDAIIDVTGVTPRIRITGIANNNFRWRARGSATVSM